ncbi:hypothetical protein [Haloarcula amylolytica]|uniref:Uncharacterized protein n=1 Tax=Haloarcula amylolytica JCM 13557 TaxID=1227452 RepID=M0JWP6_9EURY|nr:hypothetical protein [Haloarcula amylolytica]EMA13406.1 hypothetical protein C442_20761 [Haloarcula amylolytica JCM 13557]
MGLRTTIGVAFIILSYVGIFVALPPHWMPWLSPVGLFENVFVILVGVLAMVFGATQATFEQALSRPTKRERFTLPVGGTLAVVVPIHLYLIFAGAGPLAPMFLAMYLLAGIAGIITAWFASKRPY